MGAIVTVVKRTSGTEAERIHDHVRDQFEREPGVTISLDSQMLDIRFADHGTDEAESLVRQALSDASETWTVHTGIAGVVSDGR